MTQATGDIWNESQTWRAALEALDLPACACDADGRMVFFNAAAIRFWERQPSDDSRWREGLDLRRAGQPIDATTA